MPHGRRTVAVILVAGCAASLAAAGGGPEEPTGPARAAHAFLSTQFQFDAGDLADIDRGRPVTRTLDAADNREVATLGALRIGVPAAFYIDQLHDIVRFKREGAAVLQIGAFSTPARPEDLAALTLDDKDIEHLRRCRPGDCRMQLSSDAIARVQREVPWNTPEARHGAERTLREVLAALVNRYREAGDAGLMTYADGDRTLSVSTEFQAMVRSRPAILERFPDLYHHVTDFPRGSTTVEDIVYWSKEQMGPAVVLSVTHLAISRTGPGGTGPSSAASKQIYGSHYFDASLGITVVLDASDAAAPGSILVYVNRSRLDALGGFFGGLKRTIVRSRTRSTMGRTLEEARHVVERRFRTVSAEAR